MRGAGLGVLLAASALCSGACGANKNQEERQSYAAQNRDRFPDRSRCIDTCDADPGSKPVNCTIAERGIEFMDPPIWTFESSESAGNGRNLYTYSDGSEDFMLPRGYAQPSEPTNERTHRCSEKPLAEDGSVVPGGVWHVYGGLFRGWGGGMGTALDNHIDSVNGGSMVTDPAVMAIPPCDSDRDTDACFVNAVEFPDAEWEMQGSAGPRSGGAILAADVPKQLDASEWDGISFWARRGPGSQAEIRVLLGDKYTDDDMNVLNQHVVDTEEYLYCKIVRTCDCDNYKPCTEYTLSNGDIASRCYDPEVETLPPGIDDPQRMTEGGVDQFTQFERCGNYRCAEGHPTAPNADSAPLIQSRTCNPHTFETGETRDVCYDPGEDPPPAEGHETCGDFWTSTVILGLDWQFYTVPFSAMRQQGFGKEQPRLLTGELSVLRFTWDGGWIDYYIDDVRFYRVAR